MSVHGPFEMHTLPSGVTVAYRDSDHSYWRTCEQKNDGKWKGTGRLTGISTVVGPFDWRPDNLMRWAARVNCDGIAALAADGLSLDDPDDVRSALWFLQTGELIDQALDDARLSYRHTRDDAATRGTNVHKHALHALATGRPVPDFGELSREEAGYGWGVAAFWHELEPVPLFAEQVVCDPELGVAGRLDLIADVPALGGPVLIDAKTSGFLPAKHHVQLAGYERCAVASGLVDGLAGAYVLQVTPDGGYELVESMATARSFALAVEVYREAARIQSGSRAARKQGAAA